MRSGSYERGDRPRSVSDPDREAYEAMIRKHKASVAQRDGASGARVALNSGANSAARHPRSALDQVAAGVASVLNEPREARRQVEEHHYGRAILDTATAAADVSLLGSVGKGLLKREFKLLPPYRWKAPPRGAPGVRKWMTARGLASKGQHVHHGIIPANRWGKHFPDAIKNQPFNTKPMEDALTHIRIHRRSLKRELPRFNPVERYWHGTPRWWKAAHGSAIGHVAQAATRAAAHHQATPVRSGHSPKQ